MINFSSILNTLNLLDREYGAAIGVDLPQLYSKLAVLEFTGWIEVSFDTLCADYINGHVVDSGNQTKIRQIVSNNYGFKFDTNIFPMMCSVLGINNWENILDAFPTADLFNMKAVLGNYKAERDRAAHNNTISGVTPSFRTPSTVIVDYNKLKPAFQYLEAAIRAL